MCRRREEGRYFPSGEEVDIIFLEYHAEEFGSIGKYAEPAAKGTGKQKGS